MPDTKPTPRVYSARHTYEAQERALKQDLKDGHAIDVNLLPRSGKVALTTLERNGVAKRVRRKGRLVAKRTFLARHPLLNLCVRLATVGLGGCRE